MVGPKKVDSHTSVIPNLAEIELPEVYRSSSGHQGHQKRFASIRTVLHRGHTIKIITTYQIAIDGDPFTIHTMVMDDGSVHCDGLPNYSFPSAIDLVRSIIDTARLASLDPDQIGNGNDHNQHDGGRHESHNAHDGEDL